MAGRGGADSYEVWIERLHGKWTAITDEGTIKLFETQVDARKAARELITDATVVRACIFRRIVVESINCAGVHAAKMGLNKPNVQIDGVRIGKTPPSFITDALDKKEGGGA